MRSSKTGRKTSSVASVVWHVARSRWNVVNNLLFNFCERKFVQHGPITTVIVTAILCSFPKKNYPIMLLDQNSHQTVKRFGCVGFSTYECEFSGLQMLQFCFIWKDDFFLPKSASSVRRSQSRLAKRKRIGWSIDFNYWTKWTLYGVIPRPLCKIRLNEVSEMFNCWERQWIDADGALRTLSATSVIFSGVRNIFGFSRFGLSMRMPVSLSSKNNNHTKLAVLLFFLTEFSHTFGNVSRIFKVMSQYFPALFRRIHNYIHSAEG